MKPGYERDVQEGGTAVLFEPRSVAARPRLRTSPCLPSATPQLEPLMEPGRSSYGQRRAFGVACPASQRRGGRSEMASVGVGIDVPKDGLDVATTAEGPAWRVRNNATGLDEPASQLAAFEVHRVVLEASGGFDTHALHALHAADLAVVLVQPMRARPFARALSRRAKTDTIDAQVLAHLARLAVDETPLWEPVEEVIADLRALVERRQQLLARRDGERKRLRFARDIVRGDATPARKPGAGTSREADARLANASRWPRWPRGDGTRSFASRTSDGWSAGRSPRSPSSPTCGSSSSTSTAG
jgi:hypothetical protein